MNPSGVQHALFGTLPGRAIVIGVAIRLGVYAVGAALGNVPAFLSVVDTVASVGLAIGAAYFAYKLILLGKRRLLWRVRRKLILSYVFVGFIPAALIVSFFLLSNFAVWAFGTMYPHNWSGLIQCYTMAIPFFRNTFASDLILTPLAFSIPVAATALMRHLRASDTTPA